MEKVKDTGPNFFYILIFVLPICVLGGGYLGAWIRALLSSIF